MPRCRPLSPLCRRPEPEVSHVGAPCPRLHINVSVCISATRPDTIGAAVRSIVNQTYQDWELVVVAQGSAVAGITEAVRQSLGGREGRVVPQSGRGASRARNAGVAAADGELIAMTDDDCEASPEWLERLVARFKAFPRAGLVAGALAAPPKAHRGLGRCPAFLPADVVYEPAKSGHRPSPGGQTMLSANLAFTRSTAEAVGPFDELLGPGARFGVAEDDDFGYRAAGLGIVIRMAPDAVVNHTHGWRYGMREMWGLQRSYARGRGGFNAKLTLLGDPDGERMFKGHRRSATVGWWTERRPALLASTPRRWYHYSSAYRECLATCTIDDHGLLRERSAGRREY
jgi:glycosyltransferase involved in cell wall biosynthesis